MSNQTGAGADRGRGQMSPNASMADQTTPFADGAHRPEQESIR